jgi:erythromycin esterase-like protein
MRIVLSVFVLALLASCSPVPQPSPLRESAEPADTAAGGEVAAIRAGAHRLSGGPRDYDPLLAITREATFVLLGEATHGTDEFYRERARITRRLVEEQGFTAMAIEGDWPDAERVNRYVRGMGNDRSAGRRSPASPASPSGCGPTRPPAT